MKPKKSMLLSVIIVVLFAVAFIGYDWYVTESETRKYQVSVVLPYDGAGEWKNLLQGIKQAAEDYNLNVTYIVMGQDDSSTEQVEILRREIERGAEGILFAAVDTLFLTSVAETMQNETKLLAVESGVNSKEIPMVSGSNYEMGKLLGEQVVADGHSKIAVIRPAAERTYTKERMAGFAESVGQDVKVVYLEYRSEGTDVTKILKKMFWTAEYDSVVCVDTVTLEKCSDYFSEFQMETKLYGIGTSSKVAAKVDKRVIEAIVCQNEFAIGYKAAARLAGILQNKDYEIDNPTEYGLVTAENLYDTEYQELLFPISE